MLHGLGIATSPTDNNALEPPIGEAHRLLAQLAMLPEDVEATVQDKVSFAVAVIAFLGEEDTEFLRVGTSSVRLLHRAGGSARLVL